MHVVPQPLSACCIMPLVNPRVKTAQSACARLKYGTSMNLRVQKDIKLSLTILVTHSCCNTTQGIAYSRPCESSCVDRPACSCKIAHVVVLAGRKCACFHEPALSCACMPSLWTRRLYSCAHMFCAPFVHNVDYAHNKARMQNMKVWGNLDAAQQWCG